MSIELACRSSLKHDASLDSSRAWLVDEESRLPGELRADQESIEQEDLLLQEKVKELQQEQPAPK